MIGRREALAFFSFFMMIAVGCVIAVLVGVFVIHDLSWLWVLVPVPVAVLMSIDPYQTWRRLSQNEGGDQ